MAILRESVDLVIDGADFYRSIERAPLNKIRNGWCNFRLLASKQAKVITDNSTVSSISYFDPRANGPKEESYGSDRRRKLWFGRLKHLNVSEFLVSTRLDYQKHKGDPERARKATQEAMATLARRKFSANVLVLSTKKSPLLPYLDDLQESRRFSKGLILPPGESESGGLRLTHDFLESVQLSEGENDEQWDEYWRLKQDGLLIAERWQTWSAEIHQSVRKRMRRFGHRNYPEWLKSLEEDPDREKELLSLARTDLEPFIDAIRRDNRRLASEEGCARFCLQKAVREAAAAERSEWQPPAEQPRVRRWVVNLHKGCQRDTQKWPRELCDELLEKCDLLRERGPQLGPPLVKPVVGSDDPNLRRLRLNEAGGAYRIVFDRCDDASYLLLAGGKKGGCSDVRFYQDMTAAAKRRIRE
ncbi:MAG: type II toxin-antitoxin system RelE/ParE family toxin [Bryobacteraceae bacterium]